MQGRGSFLRCAGGRRAPNTKGFISFVFIQIAPAGEFRTVQKEIRVQELTFVIAVLSLDIKQWKTRSDSGNSWLLS